MLPSSWDDASVVYQDRLLEYHSRLGAELDSAQVRTNVDNNTVSIPARGDHLVRMLDELLGEQMGGKAVLDLGCGFGALATYLAWRTRPEVLVATDVNDSLLTVAEESAERTGLDSLLSFVKADMRDLSPLGDRRFDIVLANGVVFYLLSRGDLERAIEEMHRVLLPGGCVLFYQSNKWRWTDPFTGDPLVHLLPGRIGDLTSLATGWKSSRDRIRLLSPVELRRALRRRGFRDFRIVGFGKERRHAAGPGRFFGQRYVLAARRAG